MFYFITLNRPQLPLHKSQVGVASNTKTKLHLQHCDRTILTHTCKTCCRTVKPVDIRANPKNMYIIVSKKNFGWFGTKSPNPIVLQIRKKNYCCMPFHQLIGSYLHTNEIVHLIAQHNNMSKQKWKLVRCILWISVEFSPAGHFLPSGHSGYEPLKLRITNYR